MKGKFITFEGCEGSGKSTQLRLLGEWLTAHNIEYVVTREPGGSELAEKIREIILDGRNTTMCDECEALLYAASRAQNLREVVAPALREGKLVICDRYVDSSLAYQGYARNLGFEYVSGINALALNEFVPDLTFFLDISPAEAFARKNGADENDRIEQAGMAFHERVYQGYLELEKKYPRICAVDCRRSIEDIFASIINLLIEKGIVEV